MLRYHSIAFQNIYKHHLALAYNNFFQVFMEPMMEHLPLRTEECAYGRHLAEPFKCLSVSPSASALRGVSVYFWHFFIFQLSARIKVAETHRRLVSLNRYITNS